MEIYDKFVDRLQDLSIVKNPGVSKAKVLQLVDAFKRKNFGEYDTVTLTIFYLEFRHDKVSQNYSTNLLEASIMNYKYIS